MTCDRAPVTASLTPLDRHFAAFISRQAGEGAPPLLRCVASLLSSAAGSGHICLHLAAVAGRRVILDGAEALLPPLDRLRELLLATPPVGVPGEFTPLVLAAGERLYLHRYWQYERDLARVITGLAGAVCAVDEGLLRDGLARLFPAGDDGPDWQTVAAATALRKRFCVISGGPGTGKTTTVVKIIALLAEQSGDVPPRIALAAPTGKAAARLKESIVALKGGLPCSDRVRGLIPEEVATLHRLLGARGRSVRFRHSAENPLPWDVVIVDEASMVDLPLMAKLALALRSDARLILLGDRDQLASVEAGAVLGDICGRGRPVRFSPECAAYLSRATGSQLPTELIGGAGSPESRVPVPGPCLADCLVILRKNWRFGEGSVIGAAARAINAGEGNAARDLLGERGWGDIPAADGLRRALAERVVAGYTAYLRAESPAEALRRFEEFRVLCALRRGPWGVESVNLLIEEILAGEGLIDRRSRWYRGRPIMVTANAPPLKLFNGDVGIVFPDETADGRLRVCFPRSGGGIRSVSPLRLPPHETVFAMTVHKSQGSEFDRLLLILPPHDTPLLTRELVYTGLTRARSGAEVWGDGELFRQAVARRTQRDSGLEEILWGV